MALGNPVVRIPGGGRLRSSRTLELAAVIGLTVVVAVVAALWGASSESNSPVFIGSVDAPSGAAVESSSGVEASASAQDADALTIPTQTGIVPGRPDLVGPALPDSFERYQVQRGESLSTIASERGVSVSDLVAWNWHLDKDSVLIRGEWIWIPEWHAPTVADDTGSATDEEKSGRGGG